MKTLDLACQRSWQKSPSTLLLWACMLLAIPAADAGEALIVSLQTIPDRVRKQNPDLLAARELVAEAAGRHHQAGRLANPELGVDFSHTPGFEEHTLNLGIAQKFPLTRRLSLEKAVSSSALQAATAEVHDVERTLIAEAKTLLIKMLALHKQRELLKQQQTLAEQLAEHISSTAKKGESSVLDAGQARLEAAQFANQLRQLSAESAALGGQLKPLLGMTTDHPLIVSGSLPEIDPPARSVDPDRRPDLTAAKLSARAAAKAAELERAKSLDDIEVSISAGLERSEDAPEGYDTESRLGIGIRLPLPLWNNNEGAIREADARKNRKQKEVTALAHKIRHEAASAHAEMEQWAKIAGEISGTLLPMAREQAELAVNAYHEGQGDLQAALRSREQVLSLASARLDALRDFHLAKTRYEAALARP